MKTNGTYRCKHKVLGHEATIISYRGSLKTNEGQYINPTSFDEFWTVLEKLKGVSNAFDILWINGTKEERISVRASWAVVMAKINQMRTSNYKSGKLMAVRCDR